MPGFELATFRSRVRRSNRHAIPAPTDRFTVETSTPAPGGSGVVEALVIVVVVVVGVVAVEVVVVVCYGSSEE